MGEAKRRKKLDSNYDKDLTNESEGSWDYEESSQSFPLDSDNLDLKNNLRISIIFDFKFEGITIDNKKISDCGRMVRSYFVDDSDYYECLEDYFLFPKACETVMMRFDSFDFHTSSVVLTIKNLSFKEEMFS